MSSGSISFVKCWASKGRNSFHAEIIRHRKRTRKCLLILGFPQLAMNHSTSCAKTGNAVLCH